MSIRVRLLLLMLAAVLLPAIAWRLALLSGSRQGHRRRDQRPVGDGAPRSRPMLDGKVCSDGLAPNSWLSRARDSVTERQGGVLEVPRRGS